MKPSQEVKMTKGKKKEKKKEKKKNLPVAPNPFSIDCFDRAIE